MLGASVPCFGELRLDSLGEPFAARDIPIHWNVPSNAIPCSINVFKVSPPQWSHAFLSNLIALCEFRRPETAHKALALALKGRDASYIEESNGQAARRKSIVLNPTKGRVFYQGEHAIVLPKQVPEWVPSEAEALQRGLFILQRLDLSTNELRRKQTGAFHVTHEIRSQWGYTQRNGHVTVRGIYLIRAVDGFGIEGGGTCGGIRLSFGNHGKLHELHLIWPKIHTPRSKPTADVPEILSRIRRGKGTVALPGDKAEPTDIAALTVTNALVLYFAHGALEARQTTMQPFLSLDAVAEIGERKVGVKVNCPLIED